MAPSLPRVFEQLPIILAGGENERHVLCHIARVRNSIASFNATNILMEINAHDQGI